MRKRILATSIVLALGIAATLAAFYRADVPLEVLRQDYADEASRFVEVDGMNVHYKDEGSGPTVVLLHGFASSLHTWDGWVSELRPSFRLVRLDLPGHGLTGPNAENDYRTSTYVRFLAHFLDRVGVDQCSLAGNSMGGGIAWLFAARHPERVEGLILIDAGGAPRGEDEARKDARGHGGSAVMRFIRLPVIDRLVPRFTPRFLFAKALREVYADDSKVTEKLIDRYYRLALRAGNRTAIGARLEQSGEDFSDEISSIEQPTLVMWGRQDTWIPVAHADRFHAALKSSELIVYDGVGHLPMEEAPARSAADAREFLVRRVLPPTTHLRHPATAGSTVAGPWLIKRPGSPRSGRLGLQKGRLDGPLAMLRTPDVVHGVQRQRLSLALLSEMPSDASVVGL